VTLTFEDDLDSVMLKRDVKLQPTRQCEVEPQHARYLCQRSSSSKLIFRRQAYRTDYRETHTDSSARSTELMRSIVIETVMFSLEDVRPTDAVSTLVKRALIG